MTDADTALHWAGNDDGDDKIDDNDDYTNTIRTGADNCNY